MSDDPRTPEDAREPESVETGSVPPDLGALLDRAGGYREPPPTPRERIWSDVRRELVRSGRISCSFPSGRRVSGGPRIPRWTVRAAAVVALLGLGAGAGWWWSATRSPSPASSVSTVAEPREGASSAAPSGPSSGIVRRSALDHLSVSEGFLAVIEEETRDGRVDPGVASWASGLLGQTRLLMDSGESLNPALRILLEDLELILVQVVDLAGEGREGSGAEEDARLLAEGLEAGGISIRIASLLAGDQDPM